MNNAEIMEMRKAHAEAFPRCPSCFRREGHSRYCQPTPERVVELTESEKRLMWGDR